ncbi:MAG: ligase-associated DNA damage response exonuclease, partial [Bdellovibrionota bacterium]
MLSFSPAGIHCEPGGFHIDPSRRVELALITHAHSDHARRGSRRYLCERSGAGLLRHRLGPQAVVETIRYGEKIKLGRAWVSFHPAGHILGSAQIRVEIGDRVWVVSGDYKREADPTCEPFEVLPCDTFITEATFGHPQYEWSGTAGEFEEIHRWWAQCAERGRSAILFCYSL